MNKIAFGFLLGVGLMASAVADSLPIIPLPQSVTTYAQVFSITVDTAILHDAQLANEAGLLAEKLEQATGFLPELLPLSQSNSVPSAILLMLDAALTNAESYQLTVGTSGISIAGADAAGAFYGTQSLQQLIPLTAPFNVPGCTVADAPRFGWRGMHLDVGRFMFPAEDIKGFIDWMAFHKLNSFHWHLTEDQGWRIEILSWPLLTSVGGYRAASPVYGDYQTDDGIPYGGYYTQAEIRDVVAYAAARHITIIPEIDMPGHMSAAITAYPALGNDDIPDYNPIVQVRGGVYPYTLAPKESTFDWIDDVLTEVCDLFPSTYIHIGGDEAPKTQWQQSAFAQSVMVANGLANENELQSWMIQRIETMLTNKGRKLIGWDEIRQGGLSPNATVMNWRDQSYAVLSAQEGHDVVMANSSHTYYNRYQNPAIIELAKGVEYEAAPYGYVSLDVAYSYEPMPAALKGTSNAVHIIGCQGQLWSEFVHTWDKAEYLYFPRIAAMAEVAWTDPISKNFADFETRLQPMLARYTAAGVNHFDPNNPSDIPTLDGATIQTSLGTNDPYRPALAYDGTETTYFHSNVGPTTNDHFTVDLNKAHSGLATVLTGRASDGTDKLVSGALQASINGTDWSAIATFANGRATGVLPDGATHLRIVPTANQDSWLIIREIVISNPATQLSGIADWLAQATHTAGNVTASHNGGAGWFFNGTAGYAYDFGALDAIGGKPIDGSTVEFICNFSSVGVSMALATVRGYSPGNEINVLKLEQYNNTGKFGITVPGLWDKTMATDSIFDETVHVVFVQTGDKAPGSGHMDLYVNGVFVEREATKDNWRMDGGMGTLGVNPNGVDVPVGYLYGVASYDKPLTPTQIADLYAAIAAPEPVVVSIGGVDGELSISWIGQAAQTYGVQTNGNLMNGSWGWLTNGLPGNGGQITITNSVNQNQLFYRVIAE